MGPAYYSDSSLIYTDRFLSEDGTQIVDSVYDQGYTSRVKVIGLAGGARGTHQYQDGANVLTASGGVTYVTTAGAVYSYVPGGSPVQVLDTTAYLANVEHDVLFVPGATGSLSGPTSLAHPGVPTWTADFFPEALSPDGALVLGEDDHGPQVRRMSDGKVVDRPKAYYGDPDAPDGVAVGWDNDRVVTYVTSRKHKGGVRVEALERCVVATHRCSRITGWSYQALSVAGTIARGD